MKDFSNSQSIVRCLIKERANIFLCFFLTSRIVLSMHALKTLGGATHLSRQSDREEAFTIIDSQSLGFVLIISLMKEMTSTTDIVLGSPKKSITKCSTMPAGKEWRLQFDYHSIDSGRGQKAHQYEIDHHTTLTCSNSRAVQTQAQSVLDFCGKVIRMGL